MRFKILLFNFILIITSCSIITYAMEIEPESYKTKSDTLSFKLIPNALELIEGYQKSHTKEEWENLITHPHHLAPISKLFLSAYLLEKDATELKRLYEQIKSTPILEQEIINIINAKNSMNETLLHQAKSETEAEKLIALGANLNLASKLQQNPFMATLSKGYPNIAKTILKAMNIKPGLWTDLMNFSSLEYALIANDVQLVAMILDNQENEDQFPDHLNELHGDFPGYADLHLAALYCTQAIELLIKKGAWVDIQDDRAETPFLYAAQHQPLEVLELLIKHGASAKIKSNEGQNALFRAIFNPHYKKVVPYLIIVQKVDPNESDNSGGTPLAPALSLLPQNTFFENIVFELLKFGANPNLPDTNLNIVLNFGYNLTEFLKNYISYKTDVPIITSYEVDVNYLTENGQYPLATAIFNPAENPEPTENIYGPIRTELNYQIIKYLIEKGAKITQEYKDFILNNSTDEKLINLIQNVPVFTSEVIK